MEVKPLLPISYYPRDGQEEFLITRETERRVGKEQKMQKQHCSYITRVTSRKITMNDIHDENEKEGQKLQVSGNVAQRSLHT